MTKTEDTLKALVQRVARCFYGPKFIIIFDALARSDILKDKELAERAGITEKELSKLCGKLRDDQLVQFASHAETKEGFHRSFQRTHYYIDYRKFVNVIKWKVYKLRKIVEGKMRNELENKGYICGMCKTEFSSLDVDKLFDPMANLFLCDVCGNEVKQNDNAESVTSSQATLQRLTEELSPILDLLKMTDDMTIPVMNVQEIMEKSYSEAATASSGDIASTSDTTTSAGAGLRIEFEHADNETRRRLKEEEAERKRKANALPIWHARSTISGDPSGRGGDIAQESMSIDLAGQSRTKDHSTSSAAKSTVSQATAAADYESYYAELERKQTEMSTPAQAKTSDEDDESDEDFEEVNSLTNGKRSAQSLEDGGGGESALKRSRLEDVKEEEFEEEEFEAVYGNDLDEIIVAVNGQSKPFNDITEEDQEAMTAEEYQQYYEIYQKYNNS